ncbi:MAG: 4-fold beta flower protein [Candidatus Paceibacterota bacterium]|jgi:hypothetical protein
MTQNNIQFIFKSNGYYLGFIQNGFLFSRDGVPLGWLEGEYAWDINGKFRGVVTLNQDHIYILLNQFAISPLPKPSRIISTNPTLPAPQANIPAISLPIGWVDGY